VRTLGSRPLRYDLLYAADYPESILPSITTITMVLVKSIRYSLPDARVARSSLPWTLDHLWLHCAPMRASRNNGHVRAGTEWNLMTKTGKRICLCATVEIHREQMA